MNLQEYLITCLGEEGSEISQDCSKALRFTLQDVNFLEPNGPDNRFRLVGELNDLIATARLCMDLGILPPNWQDAKKQQDKRHKLLKMIEYSASVGALQISKEDLDTVKKLV